VNKTVWWSDKSNATVRVSSVASPEMAGGGIPKVLFLGTCCSSHGLTNSVISKSLNAILAVADLDYYIYADGDALRCVAFRHHTTEIRLGDSDLYAWIPACYQPRELTDADLYNDGIAAYETDAENYLCDIVVGQWGNRDWAYEEFADFEEQTGFTFDITEEQFNEWAADGFDLADQQAFYQAAFDPVSCYIFKKSIQDCLITDFRTTEDDVEYTNVIVTFLAGDQFEEFMLSAATDDWPGMGKAVAMSVHTVDQLNTAESAAE